MARGIEDRQLFNRLPKPRGRLVANAPLARLSWFRTGGSAEVLFEPADEADLVAFLRGTPANIPVTVIGVGSNMLVRDGGVDGIVIRLGRGFAAVDIRGDSIRAGAAAMDVHIARQAADAGLAGVEFLVGIPGTIGGALRMNAGAYGRDMADVLVHARAVDRLGHLHEMDAADFGFEYRSTTAPTGLIFLSAVLKAKAGDPDAVKASMATIMQERQESQPIGTRTGGSSFKNPDGYKAWELIDRAGCRGLRVGGAQISEKHCNFLINHGEATAQDIEDLGEQVRRKVKSVTGVSLEWEIQRIGRSGKGKTRHE